MDNNYHRIIRTLKLKRNFGLFFVITDDEDVREGIITEINNTFPKAKTLELCQEITRLDDYILDKDNIEFLSIVGIENSLEPYLKMSNSELYSIKPPPIFAHLNLQRERYKKEYPFSFIFFVSKEVYRLFIVRCPDFFDWRSGIFDMTDCGMAEQNAYERIQENNEGIPVEEFLEWLHELKKRDNPKVRDAVRKECIELLRDFSNG